MRLYNIYYLCKSAYAGLANLQADLIKHNNGQQSYKISGWYYAKESFDIIRQINFLASEVEDAYKTVPVFYINDIQPSLDVQTGKALMEKTRVLKIKVKAIIDLYDSLNTGDSKEGIDIKIPQCDSFKEYILYMRDIDFILSQCPLISQSNEEIVFNTVDVGSMWLSFIIKGAAGSHLILNAMSKISEIAIKFRSNLAVVKQQEELLETMKLKNEVVQETLEVFKQMKTMVFNDAVSEFEKECNTSITEPEDRDRTAKCIEKMAELIDKGLEIYSSIETPNDIRVQFPFTENAPVLPEGLLNLLEDKTNTTKTK